MLEGTGEVLLRIVDLATYFYVPEGVVKAADGVDLEVRKGEILAVVGESGSGKSVTALSAMRLIPKPPGRILRGQVLYRGEDLLEVSEREMQAVRGKRISMIFQNPHAALTPLIKTGSQLVETVVRHRDVRGEKALGLIFTLLRRLGIERPEPTLRSYPFEASMGTSQRVMLAMALLGQPELLIADEPTSMLDAIAQLEILQLIKDLKDEFGMAVWLITHDFGVVSLMADRVVVMYASQVVETGDAESLLGQPKHPYTVGLIESVPVPGARVERLAQIPGEIPDPKRLPPGCHFAPRCQSVMDVCRHKKPPDVRIERDRSVRCWLFADGHE